MQEASDLRPMLCECFDKPPLLTGHIYRALSRPGRHVVMKSDSHQAAKAFCGKKAASLGCLRRATTTRLAARPYTNHVAVLVREEMAHICIAIEIKPTKIPSAQI